MKVREQNVLLWNFKYEVKKNCTALDRSKSRQILLRGQFRKYYHEVSSNVADKIKSSSKKYEICK